MKCKENTLLETISRTSYNSHYLPLIACKFQLILPNMKYNNWYLLLLRRGDYGYLSQSGKSCHPLTLTIRAFQNP